MASNSSSSNRINVPEAKQALSNMKFEIANEMGVNLTKGYNGNLSSKDNGTVGGMMVKRMIEDYQRQASNTVK
ncbi:MAG: alpha/beta-type small acid-soluble spore protein [Clostridiales bacterium]|jgi:small acid-soluble spore protein B (major beta-type SASP)|nr:alpha/beta-type small acid-soluble spore protein [Clostridiales bacterium]OPZ68499.1 MAG: Small, acid-soluble spore protein C2 [Firmicutes bacterium ADurb.Bin467]